ncbi:hypothetical protein ACLOJK_017732 [Asimina triloba]
MAQPQQSLLVLSRTFLLFLHFFFQFGAFDLSFSQFMLCFMRELVRSTFEEPTVLLRGLRNEPRTTVLSPPQRDLAHASIGGFLSHGGLSFVTEMLALGKSLAIFSSSLAKDHATKQSGK